MTRRALPLALALVVAACGAESRGRAAGSAAAFGRALVGEELPDAVAGPDTQGFAGLEPPPDTTPVVLRQTLSRREQEALWDALRNELPRDARYADLFSVVLWRGTDGDAAESGPPDWFHIEASPSIVPLGPDPETGLLEFAVVGSGTIRLRDPATGRVPDGDDPALVMVLVPGGEADQSFELPATRTAQNNGARVVERHVRLQSFLVARSPTTLAQWNHLLEPLLDGAAPPARVVADDGSFALTWEELSAVLGRHELRVPSIAEWQYVTARPVPGGAWQRSQLEGLARGGTWWAGDAWPGAFGSWPTNGVARADGAEGAPRVGVELRVDLRGGDALGGGRVADPATTIDVSVPRPVAIGEDATLGLRLAMTFPMSFRPVEANAPPDRETEKR